mmetsp:Transcript_4746/g.12453  ORF Transcript_4746/g.12453 Transcript_4746/m.12453 type:complete len:118 (-) Transcript_4746:1618-1971(-)
MDLLSHMTMVGDDERFISTNSPVCDFLVVFCGRLMPSFDEYSGRRGAPFLCGSRNVFTFATEKMRNAIQSNTRSPRHACASGTARERERRQGARDHATQKQSLVCRGGEFRTIMMSW